MEIRFAAPADVPLILHFIRSLADYEKLADEVETTEAMLHDTLFGEKRFAEVLLGFDNAAPVGFALFFHNYSTFRSRPGIYLEDLYVEPHLRGNGYGKALLQEVLAIAQQRGCGRVEWSVLDWNTPAIDFYKSMGASAMDEWTTFRVKL